MVKIIYVANVRMPTERAHGAQIAHTCEAFARLSHEVELVVPDRRTPITESVGEYYGISQSFTITKLPVLDWVEWGRFGFIVESLSFAFAAARYVRGKGMVYGRDEVVLAPVSLFSKNPIVWESHTGAWNWCGHIVAKKAQTLVVISQGLKDFYVARGISTEKIIVAHDGVDLTSFEHVESKEAARNRLGIPHGANVALYVGRIDMWKGTGTLFQAAKHLQNIKIVVIGGEESQIRFAKQQYPDVLFLGSRPHKELANNLVSADVLVLPTTAKDEIGLRFTSPLKLFAYMASGIPIVASDVPSTREVLSDESAYWFRADNAEDLVRAIQVAAHDPRASEKARVAKTLVKRYTWDTRARTILAHL